MIITCPACHAQFHLQPNALGAKGRTVRCSSCGERWFAEPFGEPLPETATTPESSAPRSAGRRLSLTVVLAGVLVALLLAALVASRDQIASRVPAMISFYQSLGLSLEVPLGIEFRSLASERRDAEGRPVLVVTGEITNISAQPRSVPPIRVAVLDAQRRELKHGLFDPPEAALAPGGVARFEVAMAAPPEGGSDVEVSFGQEPLGR
ncbi:MAG: DUF3426 domain-containing protein [Geminicoccaceae bacterium]